MIPEIGVEGTGKIRLHWRERTLAVQKALGETPMVPKLC